MANEMPEPSAKNAMGRAGRLNECNRDFSPTVTLQCSLVEAGCADRFRQRGWAGNNCVSDSWRFGGHCGAGLDVVASMQVSTTSWAGPTVSSSPPVLA